MHVVLPEKVDFASIDVSWTRLDKVVPNVFQNLKPGAVVVALLKPHYEAPDLLQGGKINEDELPKVVEAVKAKLEKLGFKIAKCEKSPVLGEKGQNIEFVTVIEKC